MVSTTGLSVVIMTYDASDLIIKTLAHLSHQEFSTPINWEIVLVDNASTDNTIQVAQENWNNSNVPMKIGHGRYARRGVPGYPRRAVLGGLSLGLGQLEGFGGGWCRRGHSGDRWRRDRAR